MLLSTEEISIDVFSVILCDKNTKLSLTKNASNVYLTVLFKQQDCMTQTPIKQQSSLLTSTKIQYSTIQYIYVRSKSDEMASLI